MPTVLTQSVKRGGVALQFLFVACTRLGTVLAVTSVLGGLVVAWSLSYTAGGSRTALPHLFYVPIILGAVRFSWAGAFVAAVTAGLLAGPALPLDTSTGAPQPVEGWLLRLAIFVVIGLFVAWVLRDRSESIRRAFHDTLVSSRLLQAIQRGHLEVYYQPILDLTDRSVVAVEALARWTDPRHGSISPADFIPSAERTGAITALDRFVLSEAISQVTSWSATITPVRASVNISATRFASRGLCTEIGDLLAGSGLPAEQLQLEITESALIQDVVAARDQIAELRRTGVRVAIDDFGAGQASLNYLTDFAVDTVKVDRALIARIADEPRTARLVAGMVHLFRAVDLETVAEGVEDAEQFVHLESTGCRFAQGYYIGRPAPATETTELLRRTREPLPR